jgi:CRP-like cAMP-binding protein
MHTNLHTHTISQRSKEDVLEIWSELSAGDYFKDLSVPLDAQSEFCKNARLEQFDHLEAVLEAEGAKANKCYLVLSGSVSVETEAQGRIRILKESNSFGEEALRKNSVYPATYLVQNTPLLLIVVGKRDYDRKIGPYHTRDLEFKEKEYLSITAFMDWHPEILKDLAEETRIRRFAVGENLIQEGKESSDFMIIVKGFCEASKDVKGTPQVLFFNEETVKLNTLALTPARMRAHTYPLVSLNGVIRLEFCRSIPK